MEKPAVPLDRLDVDWFLLLVKPPSRLPARFGGHTPLRKTIAREIGLITRFIAVNDRCTSRLLSESEVFFALRN